MKRALALLGLLLTLAAPASAKVLIVDLRYLPNSGYSSSPRTQDVHKLLMHGILDAYGVDYTEVSPYATKTEWCRNGNQVFAGRVTHYDAVIFYGFNTQETFSATSCRPDSLTLTGHWGTETTTNGTGTAVPIFYLFEPGTSASIWQSGTTDSTLSIGPTVAYNAVRQTYSIYKVGSPNIAWKTSAVVYGLPLFYALDGSITRPILSCGPTSATTANSVAGQRCNPCDDVVASATPDSVLLYARYRSASDTAPRIFGQAGGGSVFEPGIFCTGLALLDSITGGRVFENRAKLNVKRALFIRHGTGRGNWMNQGAGPTQDAGGIYCYADSCDTLNVQAGIDSLAALNIPFTVGMDPDSLAVYPSDAARWRRARLARFALEAHGGTTSAKGGAASVSAAQDPFGHLRTRTLLPGATASTIPDCGAADSCLYCILLGAKNVLRQYFPTQLDPSVLPAFGDWTPTGFTIAGSSTTLDSLYWAIWRAGFRTVLFGQDQTQSNAGRHWGDTGATEGNRTAPSSYYANGRPEPIFSRPPFNNSSGTARIGTLNFVRMRAEAPTLNLNSINQSHDIAVDWTYGFYAGVWFTDYGLSATVPMYHHDFFAKTPVVSFSASQLGGHGQGTTATMDAFWVTKWLVMRSRAAESCMIPGKRLDRWVYTSEIAP